MKMNAARIWTSKQIQTIGPLMSSGSGNAAYRLTQSAASVVLIGSVYVLDMTPMGIFLVLPLIGIYTALGVVFGYSPLAMIIDANKPIPYIVEPAPEAMPTTSTNAQPIASSRAA